MVTFKKNNFLQLKDASHSILGSLYSHPTYEVVSYMISSTYIASCITGIVVYSGLWSEVWKCYSYINIVRCMIVNVIILLNKISVKQKINWVMNKLILGLSTIDSLSYFWIVTVVLGLFAEFLGFMPLCFKWAHFPWLNNIWPNFGKPTIYLATDKWNNYFLISLTCSYNKITSYIIILVIRLDMDKRFLTQNHTLIIKTSVRSVII